jgi:hypothetical protein
MQRTYPKKRIAGGSTSSMYFSSISITEQSVIAVAEHLRRGCPQPTFPEEITLVQNADRGLLPALRHNGEFTFPFCI